MFNQMLSDDDFALIEVVDETVQRLFPIPDRAHARAALRVCYKAEKAEKEPGPRFWIHLDKERRYKVRKAVWDRWRIPPIYFDKDTEIQVDEQ